MNLQQLIINIWPPCCNTVTVMPSTVKDINYHIASCYSMTSSGSVCYWHQSRRCDPVWWNVEASNGCGKVTAARTHPAILGRRLCYKAGLLMFHAGCNWPASCGQIMISHFILHFPKIPQQSSAKQWPHLQIDCYVTYVNVDTDAATFFFSCKKWHLASSGV